MNLQKQRLILESLISSPDTFTLCRNIIKHDYFDIELAPTVQFIMEYYESFNGLPKPKIIEAETGIKLKKAKISSDQINYTVSEIELFCKRMAMQEAILTSANLIETNEWGSIEELMKEALMVSVHDDLGIAYFETVKERLERLKHGNEIIPTKWANFNEKLFGGPARKELVLFAAGSGGGKSVVLSNLGLDYADQGQNVLYISLELSQDIVAQRFDSMITGIGRKEWIDRIPEIVNGVKSFKNDSTGRLDVVYMKTETKCIEIRAYLKNYQMHFDCLPDIILVDYLDKLAPNNKVSGNSFDIDKKISEQLRQIAVDCNSVIITASQLNRSAVDEVDQNHSHIAGGISKINEADVFVTLFMNDTMRQEGLMYMNFQKTRNSDGVGNSINMNFNHKTLKITDGKPDINNESSTKEKISAKSIAEELNSDRRGDMSKIFGNN